jgi:hypothetical protein
MLGLVGNGVFVKETKRIEKMMDWREFSEVRDDE